MTAPSASSEVFTSLAAQLRDGRSEQETYQAIVEAGLRLVDGCDRAAIGLLQGSSFRSAAASDEIMSRIDGLQDELREGPCLEASADEAVHLDNDMVASSRWPRLAERVVAETPVRAMLAVPLVLDGQRGGALNLFADRPGAFDEASIDSGAILAAFASVAIARARELQRADQLKEGLVTNREIGAAIGILMATRGLTSEEAFEVLSQASQRLNRKLRDIASGIVRGETTSR